MYEVWNVRKKAYEKARESIQTLIDLNYEDVEDTVIEFLDGACDVDELSEPLVKLRDRRDRLFDVRDQIDESIEWYTDQMNKVRDIEYPNGLPEENQE